MNRGASPISTRNAELRARNNVRASRRTLSLFVFALIAAALPSPAMACAACFGKSSDAMAQGMNLGIFALLVVIVSVLIGIASFFVFLARRSARFAAATADETISTTVPAAETSSSTAQTIL
jgi:hypothetical protein